MRTVTIYNYLLLMTSVLGNAKLQCAKALGSKGKESVREKKEEKLELKTWTRRVESGTTTTYASVEGL